MPLNPNAAHFVPAFSPPVQGESRGGVHFDPCATFQGERVGYKFTRGELGVGYYREEEPPKKKKAPKKKKPRPARSEERADIPHARGGSEAQGGLVATSPAAAPLSPPTPPAHPSPCGASETFPSLHACAGSADSPSSITKPREALPSHSSHPSHPSHPAHASHHSSSSTAQRRESPPPSSWAGIARRAMSAERQRPVKGMERLSGRARSTQRSGRGEEEEKKLEAAQLAVSLGKKQPAKPDKKGNPRWMYTHDGVAYIMNESSKKLITCWSVKPRGDGAKARDSSGAEAHSHEGGREGSGAHSKSDGQPSHRSFDGKQRHSEAVAFATSKADSDSSKVVSDSGKIVTDSSKVVSDSRKVVSAGREGSDVAIAEEWPPRPSVKGRLWEPPQNDDRRLLEKRCSPRKSDDQPQAAATSQAGGAVPFTWAKMAAGAQRPVKVAQTAARPSAAPRSERAVSAPKERGFGKRAGMGEEREKKTKYPPMELPSELARARGQGESRVARTQKPSVGANSDIVTAANEADDALFGPPLSVPMPTKLQGSWGQRSALDAIKAAPTQQLKKALPLPAEAAALLRAEVEAEYGKKGKQGQSKKHAAASASAAKAPAPAPSSKKPKPQATTTQHLTRNTRVIGNREVIIALHHCTRPVALQANVLLSDLFDLALTPKKAGASNADEPRGAPITLSVKETPQTSGLSKKASASVGRAEAGKVIGLSSTQHRGKEKVGPKKAKLSRMKKTILKELMMRHGMLPDKSDEPSGEAVGGIDEAVEGGTPCAETAAELVRTAEGLDAKATGEGGEVESQLPTGGEGMMTADELVLATFAQLYPDSEEDDDDESEGEEDEGEEEARRQSEAGEVPKEVGSKDAPSDVMRGVGKPSECEGPLPVAASAPAVATEGEAPKGLVRPKEASADPRLVREYVSQLILPEVNDATGALLSELQRQQEASTPRTRLPPLLTRH
ncbi:MAG: hypothetical protein SGPRY_013171, partial [Prymnesium sp.]